jgi:hypothetical protein
MVRVMVRDIDGVGSDTNSFKIIPFTGIFSVFVIVFPYLIIRPTS